MPDKLFFFSSHLYDKEDEYEFYPGSGLEDALYESQTVPPMRSRSPTQTHAHPRTRMRTLRNAHGLSKHSTELALCTRSACGRCSDWHGRNDRFRFSLDSASLAMRKLPEPFADG